MNWISSVVRPKIRGIWKKRDTPDNLWVKCPESGQMVYYKAVSYTHLTLPTILRV